MNQKELINRVAESELAIEQLEVVFECATDVEVKDIICNTIIKLQICLNEWAQELCEEQSFNKFN